MIFFLAILLALSSPILNAADIVEYDQRESEQYAKQVASWIQKIRNSNLFMATFNSNKDRMRLWLRAGADPNGEERLHGKLQNNVATMRPLFYAIKNAGKNPEALALLLSARADYNASVYTFENRSLYALCVAAGCSGNDEACHQLLNCHHIDPNITHGEEQTPLLAACLYKRSPSVVARLLQIRANVNTCSPRHETPLSAAITNIFITRKYPALQRTLLASPSLAHLLLCEKADPGKGLIHGKSITQALRYRTMEAPWGQRYDLPPLYEPIAQWIQTGLQEEDYEEHAHVMLHASAMSPAKRGNIFNQLRARETGT